MSKLWLIGLAASAAWTPAAIAQGAPPPPPPPPIAHGAHAPGHGAMVGHSGGGHMKGGGHMRGGGHMKGMPGGHRLGGMKGMPGGHRMGGMKGMPGGHHMGGIKRIPGGHHMGGIKGIPGGHHMGGMKGWQRFGRGHIVPRHFRNRQFFVHNWQSFGWPAPMPGGQWIRYYDDALLVDGHGRVVDGRYGWDWDRRGGDHIAYDDRGYDEGYDEDYAGYDDYGRDDYGYDDDRGDCRGDCGPARHVPPPQPHPGYGHGYGYGYGSAYGYGYGAGCACGPVVITETTTTTAPVVETRTYYETVYEHRAAPRRHYKKPVVRRSVKPAYRAPAPRPGERG